MVDETLAQTCIAQLVHMQAVPELEMQMFVQPESHRGYRPVSGMPGMHFSFVSEALHLVQMLTKHFRR